MLLSRRVAISGISAALILLFITASYLSPTADLVFYTMASLCIALAVIYAGYRAGLSTYAASSVLIFLIFGIWHVLPFLFLFGIYPILKGLIESRMKKAAAFAAKSACFGAAATAGYLLFAGAIEKTPLYAMVRSWLPASGTGSLAAILCLAAFIVLLAYDAALTLLIAVIAGRLDKALRK